jgi:hypothetical protein
VSPIKRSHDRFPQYKAVKFKSVRNHPQVIKVLEARIGNAQRDQRFELLGDDSFDRVAEQIGGRAVEQYWTIQSHRPWGNSVTKTDINLNCDAGFVYDCSGANTNAAIFFIVSDRSGSECKPVKYDSIVCDLVTRQNYNRPALEHL